MLLKVLVMKIVTVPPVVHMYMRCLDLFILNMRSIAMLFHILKEFCKTPLFVCTPQLSLLLVGVQPTV